MKLYHQYKCFFGEELNRQLYAPAINKNETFTMSRTSHSGYYPEWRKSKVIYDEQFHWFKKAIEQKIRASLCEVLPQLSIGKFEIESFEVQLTSHNDGDYFKWHKDNSTIETASRLITFVYYFHSLPKAFDGGKLILYDGETQHVVEPENDSIIFFYSGRKHEVTPVICPTKLFKDGRFTLNGWIRHKTMQSINSDCFGYNMFTQYPTPTINRSIQNNLNTK